MLLPLTWSSTTTTTCTSSCSRPCWSQWPINWSSSVWISRCLSHIFLQMNAFPRIRLSWLCFSRGCLLWKRHKRVLMVFFSFISFLLIKWNRWQDTVSVQQHTDQVLVGEQEGRGIGLAKGPPGLSWPGWCCLCCSFGFSLHPEPDRAKKKGEDEWKPNCWKHVFKATCWLHVFCSPSASSFSAPCWIFGRLLTLSSGSRWPVCEDEIIYF